MTMERARARGLRPTTDENLIIRAAIDPDSSIRSWEAWLASNDLDEIPTSSFDLLPLVYRNLRSRDYRSRDLPKLRGVYRQTWYRNQLLISRSLELFEKLEVGGIRAVLLGDAPLILGSYGDIGARVIRQAELLVSPHDLDRAIGVADGHGWRPCNGVHPDATGLAKALCSSDGLLLVLRWYLAASHAYEEATEPFREGAIFFSSDAGDVRVPNLTDQLVYVLITGAEWQAGRSFHWIPDAITILRHDDVVDWQRFVWLAQHLERSSSIRSALSFLTRYDPVSIPASVIDDLAAFPRSELLEQWFRVRSGRQYPWGGMPMTWFRYARTARAARLRATPAGFVSHLRARSGAESATGFAVDLIRRAYTRVGAAMGEVARRDHRQGSEPHYRA